VPSRRNLDPDASATIEIRDRSTTWHAVASIWADVLGVSEVRDDDDFLSLGGHSLRAMQIVARIREALGVDISVRTLYETPAFDSWVQAYILSEGAEAELESALAEIEGLSEDSPLPVCRLRSLAKRSFCRLHCNSVSDTEYRRA